MSTSIKTIKIYLSYWRQSPWLTAGSFLLGPGYALQTIVAPLFVAKILGQLVNRQPINPVYVWSVISALLGGVVIWYVADKYCGSKLVLKVTKAMHEKNFDHLMDQEYSFFTNTFGGSLVTQANRFVRSYELFHIAFFLDLLGQLFGVAVALGIMLYYNLSIGAIVGIAWFASVTLVVYLGIKRMPFRRHAIAAETQQTGELADSVTNAITVKTFANENFEAKRYNKINTERNRRFRISWDLGIRNYSTFMLLGGVLQLIVLLGGIHAIQHNQISLATFLLFEVYILRIIDSVAKATLFVRQFEGMLGDAHEMTELLERKPLINDPLLPEEPRIGSGELEFALVSFKYPEQQNNQSLFTGLNLKIAAGEHVGLVGPSGGGKTTITRLLLRFHDIDEGIIKIDGQNIASIKQSDLHRFVGYVPQEPLLFHRSLAENIAYGSTATLDQIKATARKAHASEFIESLPQGYDTLVGERGVKLSGGQRQRIAIARAMLKDAPILVLDEATSALDSESEQLVQDGLWQLMSNKTALVIAHRLSTIQKMDRIVVLNQGKIVEEGKHAELLKHGGLYAKLWRHQSGGFLED